MKRLLAGAACLVVLTGCSSSLSPKDTLKDGTAQLLDAANNGSETGVHSAAAALRSTIQDQVASGDLSAAQADTLRTLISKIETETPLLTAASPTPPPSPTATASATVAPTPSPTPSKSPTPSPTPSLSPRPSPTREPTTPPATLGVGLGSPSPAAS